MITNCHRFNIRQIKLLEIHSPKEKQLNLPESGLVDVGKGGSLFPVTLLAWSPTEAWFECLFDGMGIF